MRFRTFSFLLLAALFFWTSGAAVYLHEALEHGEHDEVAAAERGHETPHPAKQPAHSHNHDDCPTCQLLAHLQADRPAPAVAMCTLLLSSFAPEIADRHAPTRETRSLLPIRGPPAMTAHFA